MKLLPLYEVSLLQVTRGFCNWKDAIHSFRKHEKSVCHHEAVEVMITLPATTRDIGEQLSHQHAIQKEKNRDALYQIFSSVKYLCRQGLSLRGDGNEKDGNFIQLLLTKAEEDKNLSLWMKRKENVYTSPEIQNEIVKVLGVRVLRELSSSLQSSPFLAIMVDETTDVANKEQAAIVIRWVESFHVFEEFIGLYSIPSLEAKTIVAVIKDVLTRLNLDVRKVRGQCYDGASVMRGPRSGVATLISSIEPRAVYTHCYGHSLNLAASDALKESKLMNDALETVHEITKLIKFSPRRDGIFHRLKEDASFAPGIRVLCPTRWTVRADAIASVISNFEVLECTWEEACTVTKDTEAKARIRGVSVVMKTFNFVFGAMLGEMILRHADNLSSTLQHKSMSAAEGQEIAHMTVQTLQTLRSDQSFDLFWSKVNHFASSHDVSEPQLPRKRKKPRRFEEGVSAGEFHETPKQYYRQHYFEAIDLIVNCTQDRFNQAGYKIYSSLEALLIKACKGENFEHELEAVCTFYGDDFVQDLLLVQLRTFAVHFQHQIERQQLSKVSIFDLKTYFLSLSKSQVSLMEQVAKLMQLILIMPATNSTAERSFSALRRVKSYLRSTMLQERLNYLMLLHVHKDQTDKLCLKTTINDFIGDSVHRTSIFGTYKV